MRVDDTCCMFGSIISDHCPALNAPVAFTLTLLLILRSQRSSKKRCRAVLSPDTRHRFFLFFFKARRDLCEFIDFERHLRVAFVQSLQSLVVLVDF